MKTLKQTLLASAGVIVVTGSVYAADLPLKAAGPMMLPVSNWTGPYIGAHVGAGSYQNTCRVAGISAFGYNCSGGDNTDFGRDISFVGGVQAGYDWQDRYFVYGVAADWSWTGLKTKTFGNSGSLSHTSKVNWLASFRGRAGLAVDTTLLYVTGGVAIGHFKDEVLQGISGGGVSFSDTLVGWVAGVGVEHRFNRNWSVALEYLHYDFGTNNRTYSTVNSGGSSYNHDFTHVVDAVRVGLNYRW
jgi:outer membrane immunogenic protein